MADNNGRGPVNVQGSANALSAVVKLGDIDGRHAALPRGRARALDGTLGKVAVVGLGYWGPKLLRNLSAQIGDHRVVAVDTDATKLAASRRQYPAMECHHSLEAALEDPAVAAVIVATPVSSHFALARQALDAGCGVLVEKPLAASAIEARSLVAHAEALGLVLMVAHTFLFSRRVQWLAQHIRAGDLGAIHYATSSRLNLGLHRADVNVIWDLAPHDFSILFHLLDEFPSSVQTSGRGLVHGGGCDVAFINLTFPSGVVAAVDVSWMSPKKIRNTSIVGDRRMAIYDDTNNEAPVQLYDRGVTREDSADFGSNQLMYRYGDTILPYIAADEPLSLEIVHFLECIAGRTACLSDGRFGLRVVEALEAADTSRLLGGRRVEVAANVGSDAIDLDGRGMPLSAATRAG